jgi:large subunit ribosomal protein L6
MTTPSNVDKHSRIGKQPIPLPDKVQVSIDGSTVKVKGPRGELVHQVPAEVEVRLDDGVLHLAPKKGSGKTGRQHQGLSRALLRNAVQGVAEGFRLSLDLYGVGYRAELKGRSLTLSLGLSHPVQVELPEAVSARVEVIDEAGTKRPRVHLESNDRQQLGATASRLRSFRPPEPYKGKGVRYTGERIKIKAGKAGSKS